MIQIFIGFERLESTKLKEAALAADLSFYLLFFLREGFIMSFLPRKSCAVVVFCVLFAMSGRLVADEVDFKLCVNKAVQRELGLSAAQQANVDKLLKEMDDESWYIVQGDGRDEERIRDLQAKLMARQGQKFVEMLDRNQQARFWQIALQSRGRERAMMGDRARTSLKLTDPQKKEIDQIIEEAGTGIRKLATDTSLGPREMKDRFEQAKLDCLEKELKVLTETQRKEFDELFGKPFDLELLERVDGVKPRALTVIFPSRGNSAYFFLAPDRLQESLGVSSAQATQIEQIVKQADADLTVVRLGVLKKLEKDFRELPEEEKRKVAKSILDAGAPINREAAKELLKILTPDQIAKFDQLAMRNMGPRAIEAESVATRLKLTDEQKAVFAKLTAEFDDTTAPWIVVRRNIDIDRRYDGETKKLEAAILAILTPEQRQMLESVGK